MDGDGLLDLMAWVRDECAARGCTDSNVTMRLMHDARRKAAANVGVNDIRTDTVNALKAAGYFASAAEREQAEDSARNAALAEEQVQARINLARAGRVLGPTGEEVQSG